MQLFQGRRRRRRRRRLQTLRERERGRRRRDLEGLTDSFAGAAFTESGNLETRSVLLSFFL